MNLKKLILLIIIIVFIILIGVIYYVYNKNGKIENEKIKYMYFNYSTGTMMYSNVSYNISKEKDNYYATIKPDGISDEEKVKVKITEKELNKIMDILIKYKVNKWDGFSKSDRFVLDGNSFSFVVRFESEKYISASGYTKWPNNYYEVRDALDEIFMELYNKEVK